ncbi:MAG TPA: L-histidine N(alpha)-methyltransferase [Gammaproteobacteria bacterium]|nr:L-histidine N(alpha)-methyltransferase [Gammaproteobacteria bacterium]
MKASPRIPYRNLDPAGTALRREVLAGLRAPRKHLPSKYLYDEEGSRLFEAICALPEYYLTRTELAIFDAHVAEMAHHVGSRALVIEPGSGASEKAVRLLDALHDPVAYVPVDIAREQLLAHAAALATRYPGVEILPVWADFTCPFAPPLPRRSVRRTICFFPGSTLGNFEPDVARQVLARLAALAGRGGALLVGIDLVKDRAILEPAYDDAGGVTAAFNLNLLARMNRELGADFTPRTFAHRAFFNMRESRIEMHLVSLTAQRVHVGGETFVFERGETIHTENSYKFTHESFAALAASAGLAVRVTWTDERGWCAVKLLEAA